MNNYNNMGGIVNVQFLFPDEIALFSVINHTAIVKLHEGHTWRILPILPMTTAPTINPDTQEAGSIYKLSLVIRLKRYGLNSTLLSLLHSIDTRGCILKCRDANGNIRIYGTKDYPLFGIVTEKQGTSATDYSGYELNLSGISLHPQLPYSEL